MPFPVLAAANLALGAFQAFKGVEGLKQLEKEEYPEYSISPELRKSYQRAEGRTGFGFDPRQTAAFKQNVAQQQRTGMRQAISRSGGNLAQALSVGFGAANTGKGML